MSRVEEIIQFEADAELYEGQANECRWNAAELIAAELKSGKSQRQLASEISKSYEHVRIMAKTWNVFGKCQPRLAFNVAYHSPEVRGTPEPTPEPITVPEPTPEPTRITQPIPPTTTPPIRDPEPVDIGVKAREWRERNPDVDQIPDIPLADDIRNWFDTVSRSLDYLEGITTPEVQSDVLEPIAHIEKQLAAIKTKAGIR